MNSPDWVQIERESPGLSIASARFIGEGWNTCAYLVNDELVFRFPKHAAHWEELEREIAFLRFAAGKLPLLTPRYVNSMPNSRASAWGYASYGYIRGERFDPALLKEKERDRAADALAAFLKALHALEPEPPVDGLLPYEDEQQVARECLAGAEHVIMPQLAAADAGRMREMFEFYLRHSGSTGADSRVVVHADLSGDHILMDQNAVTGVVDFGDVNWGDADYDFMYLFTDFGLDFAEKVARRYGHAQIDRLRQKLHYFGMVDQINTILENEGRSLAGQKAIAWDRLNQILRSKLP